VEKPETKRDINAIYFNKNFSLCPAILNSVDQNTKKKRALE